MRKSLWIAVLVTVLCIGLGVTGFVRLNESGKQIQYEETVLFGDKSAINGLTVRHQLGAPTGSGYLYWDTAYRPAEGISETDYIYREKKLETPVENKEYLNIGVYSGGGIHTTGSIDLEKDGGEWAPVLLDVAQHAGTELSYSEIVDLKDYFEYYPMSISVNIGTLQIYSDSGMWDSDVEQWMKILQNEFRIPIPEKSGYVKVEMFKRTDGSVYAYSISPVESIPSFSTYSLITEKDCYLLVERREKDVDSSRVKQYWAIYRIPYETVEDAGSCEKTILHMEEMQKIASEDSGISFHKIRYDEKMDRIEIICGEGSGLRQPTLMVFDVKTGETVQAMTLTESDDDTQIHEVYCHDDFIVITMRDLRQDGRRWFTLLSRGADGRYQIEFEGDFPEKEVTDNEIWLKIYDPQYAVSMDFDGERLVMGAIVNGYLDGSKQPGLFQIIVYEAGELIFHGQYQSSLVIGEDIDDGWQHLKWTPLTVSWD